MQIEIPDEITLPFSTWNKARLSCSNPKTGRKSDLPSTHQQVEEETLAGIICLYPSVSLFEDTGRFVCSFHWFLPSLISPHWRKF